MLQKLIKEIAVKKPFGGDLLNKNPMNHDELWQAVLGEIELSISKASFTTWFKNTAVVKKEDRNLVISVPNIFAKEWLEKKYRKVILGSVQKYYPEIESIACVIGQPKKEAPGRSIDSVVINQPSPASDMSFKNNPTTANQGGSFIKSLDCNLNPRYQFETFVVGSNNELAYAACRSVAENPGKNYNPLFVYGGVGLGKTHLLQSIGNCVLKSNPGARIKYTSMERFANELVSALQNSKAREFKKDYVQLDVLIIDDVQFLAKKEKTQEEFFHVFETLYQLGKQVILSSDRPPKSIPTLEDRLRSRFEGGMMADISKPDFETRIAIIKRKLVEKNFDLSDEAVVFLAENIYHNIRELEGALNKIIATCQLRNIKPDLEQINELISDLLSSNRNKDLIPEKIIESVAAFFDVKPEEISSRCRKKKIIRPRQVAIYLIRKELNASFPEIGQIIGGRDHSTAIYAYEKIETELKDNKVLSDHIKFIRESFGGV